MQIAWNYRQRIHPVLMNLLMLVLIWGNLRAQNDKIITVDASGKGQYPSLTAALQSLPLDARNITIFLKKGVYEEKILIRQSGITIRGEDRDATIIRYNQLRSAWEANKDSIGPAVVNIYGDDLTFENLTIANTQAEIGPHAFALLSYGTRLIARNCKFLSRGADTVSPWNAQNGMYYFVDCYFEGAVDFVCPRGWCYIGNSQFYEVKETAAIWHAGGHDPKQKFVIVNSYFDGVPNFQLGRHHYDAQFYLINCDFSANLADQPIFRKTYEDTTQNKPFYWGPRYYFYNCHRQGGDYEWFKDNLTTAPGSPQPKDITPGWTFDYRWDPEVRPVNPNK